MSTAALNDLVLIRFRQALNAAFGDRVERVACSVPGRAAIHTRTPTTMWRSSSGSLANSGTNSATCPTSRRPSSTILV
jgi:hypothetical protein